METQIWEMGSIALDENSFSSDHLQEGFDKIT